VSRDLLTRERVSDLRHLADLIDVVANKWPGGPVVWLRALAKRLRAEADTWERNGEEMRESA
jgi:hypothetical protein